MGRWDGYIKTQKPCTNPECKSLVWKGKYCGKCKQRLRRTGDINGLRGRRNLEYNEKFIQVQTKESAWFIGWIASDGYINEKRYAIRLEICDKEVLEIIVNLLNYKGEIKTCKMRDCNKKQPYRLIISNKEMCEDFVDLGIRQNKSKTIQMPKIEDEFFYHFLRGVIEGDGSVIRGKNKRLFVFLNSASKIFLEQLAQKINMKYKIMELKTGVYRLVYWGKNSEELCKKLYKDSEGIRLTRKYEKYIGETNVN